MYMKSIHKTVRRKQRKQRLNKRGGGIFDFLNPSSSNDENVGFFDNLKKQTEKLGENVKLTRIRTEIAAKQNLEKTKGFFNKLNPFAATTGGSTRKRKSNKYNKTNKRYKK